MAREWTRLGARVTVYTAMPSRRIPGARNGTIPPEYRHRLLVRERFESLDVIRSWVFASPRQSTFSTLAHNISFALSGGLSVALHARRPDVLIVSGPPYFPLFGGTAAAMLRGIPRILELRDLWPEYAEEMGLVRSRLLRRALYLADRALLSRATAIVTVTDSFRQTLEAKVRGVPVRVFPNGVDLDFYKPAEERVDANRTFTFGYAGTLGYGQDVPAVIRAFGRARRSASRELRLLVVGDGSERDSVEGTIAREGLGGAVVLSPPIARADTPAFYRSCDALLVPLARLPSLEKTVPSKLFEVMASGRPVLGAFRGDSARILDAARCGVLAAPGDDESISLAMRRLFELPAEARGEMGRSGREWAVAHASRRDIAREYFAFLRELCGEG